VVDVAHYSDDLIKQVSFMTACDFFIGVDSAWCHIAGCMGKQGSVIFMPDQYKAENVIGHYSTLKSIEDPSVDEMLFQIPNDLLEKASVQPRPKPTPYPIDPSSRPKILVVGSSEGIPSDLVKYSEMWECEAINVLTNRQPNDLDKYDLVLSVAGDSVDVPPNILHIVRDGRDIYCPNYDYECVSENLCDTVHYICGLTWPDRVRKGKIALERSAGLGDVLLTYPLLKKMRCMFPDARLFYMSGNTAHQLLCETPCIDGFDSRESKEVYDLLVHGAYYDL
jgi:hypothetical protein